MPSIPIIHVGRSTTVMHVGLAMNARSSSRSAREYRLLKPHEEDRHSVSGADDR